MVKLNLKPNEVIILHHENISRGDKSRYKDELVLTNLCLVHVEKGMFNKIKNINVFPVNTIKVYNNKAQAFANRRNNGYNYLDIYFINGQESFGFSNKSDIQKYVKEINKLLVAPEEKKTINTNELKTTIIDTATSIIGALKVKPKQISTKCPSCGATIAGEKGKNICCDYCGMYHTLK